MVKTPCYVILSVTQWSRNISNGMRFLHTLRLVEMTDSVCVSMTKSKSRFERSVMSLRPKWRGLNSMPLMLVQQWQIINIKSIDKHLLHFVACTFSPSHQAYSRGFILKMRRIINFPKRLDFVFLICYHINAKLILLLNFLSEAIWIHIVQNPILFLTIGRKRRLTLIYITQRIQYF